MRPEQFQNQRGFTLTEILLAVGISSLLLIGIVSVLTSTSEDIAKSSNLAEMESLKTELISLLNSPAAWQNTVNANVNMSCLSSSSPTPCAPNVPRAFSLRDAANNVFFDSTVAGAGFDSRGRPCAGANFSMAGNDDCPFRYDLTWSVLCAPGSCRRPQVLVNAHLLYRPSVNSRFRLVMDEDRYSVNNFIVTAGVVPCAQRTQQLIIYNNGNSPLNTTFMVPSYANRLFVELWGGGGGGAASNGTAGNVAGSDGGATIFGNPPVLTAAGGAGGGAAAAAGSLGICFPFIMPFGGGQSQGFAAQPGDPNLLAAIPAGECAPSGTATPPGAGGYSAMTGGPGGSYGGGGGGSCCVGAGAAPCPAWIITSLGGAGGSAAWTSFAPGALTPGALVQITIGHGGAGATGLSMAVVMGFPLAFPNSGGSGGPGALKVTWY